ncbi:MAG: HAMP domain-containing sensor histidine kinase, partial [Desulfobacterales bacterium]
LSKRMYQMAEALGYWNDRDVPESLVKEYEDYLAEKNLDDIKDTIDKRSDRINRGIERIATIVDSLRSFSRVDLATTGKIDINQSIQEAITIMNVENTGDVAFEKELQDVPPLPCDTLGLNQCLHHVLKNALDAVDDDGVIKVGTTYDKEQDQITIEITDNGKGMSPEVLRKARNPFFTTKEVGSGTGVGLSLTEKIIKRHGGNVDMTSTEGMGTTVTMRLPVAGGGTAAASDTDT